MNMEDEFTEFDDWLKKAHTTWNDHLEMSHLGINNNRTREIVSKQNLMLLELCGALEELGELVKRRRRL